MEYKTFISVRNYLVIICQTEERARQLALELVRASRTLRKKRRFSYIVPRFKVVGKELVFEFAPSYYIRDRILLVKHLTDDDRLCPYVFFTLTCQDEKDAEALLVELTRSPLPEIVFQVMLEGKTIFIFLKPQDYFDTRIWAVGAVGKTGMTIEAR